MKNETRYEIVTQNGQVLEHGIKDQRSAVNRVWNYLNECENFTIREYQVGKYGKED